MSRLRYLPCILLAACFCLVGACTPVDPVVVTPPTSSPPIVTPEETPPPTETPEETPPETAPPEAPSPPTDEAIESFFDDAVFVGDSISAGIEQYVRLARKDGPMLGTARFLTTTIGIRVSDCAGENGADTVFYSYKGVEQPLDEIIAAMDAGKVFLMLGMNDLAGGAEPGTVVEHYGKMLDSIESAAPDVEIIILLNTPRTDSTWVADYTRNKQFFNTLIDTFCTELAALCDERGLRYIDLNTPLKAGTAGLPQEYTRDGYLHLSHAGAAVAVNAFYDFARLELTQNG